MDSAFALNGLDFSPEFNLARYLQSIRKFPILEQDEEYRLAVKYKETKDEKIAYKLVQLMPHGKSFASVGARTGHVGTNARYGRERSFRKAQNFIYRIFLRRTRKTVAAAFAVHPFDHLVFCKHGQNLLEIFKRKTFSFGHLFHGNVFAARMFGKIQKHPESVPAARGNHHDFLPPKCKKNRGASRCLAGGASYHYKHSRLV